jgi:hypothetical protein
MYKLSVGTDVTFTAVAGGRGKRHVVDENSSTRASLSKRFPLLSLEVP